MKLLFLFVWGTSLVACKQSPVVKLHDLRNDMCACDDIECAKSVYEELKSLKEPENSMESRNEIIGVMGELAECANKLEHPEAAATE